MERREFGKTGLKTSLLGFGGFHLLEIPVVDASKLLNQYLDAGGNYIETAISYGDGESERKIGHSVSHRRSEYVLVTKTGERDKTGCLASLHKSLENLKTDHVDVLLMHGVGSMEDLDKILAPGGAVEGAEQAVKEGKINFIGLSMHGQPDVLIEALKRYPFSAVMSTINYYDRFNFPEIEETLIPLAQEKNTAIILMKPVADGLLYRNASPAFRYAFSQPVSVVVAGINNQEMLDTDLAYAEAYKPMTQDEKDELYKSAPELGNYVCRQCGECMPCPEGIDIPLIFKLEGYYDRQMASGVITDTADFALRERLRFWFGNRDRAKKEYQNVSVKADKCTSCGECMSKCPYDIDIIRKLGLADYKLAEKLIY